eukprot:c25868_g1_i1 orf=77-832(+)
MDCLCLLCPPSKVCPICLDCIVGAAYLDPCFHEFCFHCILQWSEMVLAHFPEAREQQLLDCPLCKAKYSSIIHEVSGQGYERCFLFGSQSEMSKFFLSEAHARRLAAYEVLEGRELGKVDLVATKTLDMVKRASKRGGAILGLVRLEQLHMWIRRELQALLREEDVELLMHHVVGILQHFDSSSRNGVSRFHTGSRNEFPKSVTECLHWKIAVSEGVRDFLGDNAERFSSELERFLLSGLSVEAYDELTGD